MKGNARRAGLRGVSADKMNQFMHLNNNTDISPDNTGEINHEATGTK